MKCRILWSGITGRVGKVVQTISDTNEFSTIVAGICRNDDNYYNYEQLDDIKEEFDVIVDFSHKDSFDKVLEFALREKKPLVVGTGRLSDEQIQAMEEAAYTIPIFKGGNFLFKVEEFMKTVVDKVKQCDDELVLVETHYKSKNIPSETAKSLVKRVFDECGKNIKIDSRLEYDELINDYRVGDIHCRVVGFNFLAEDVLKIAKMMVDKQPKGVYTLESLLADNEN